MHKQNQFELNKCVRNLNAVAATCVRLGSWAIWKFWNDSPHSDRLPYAQMMEARSNTQTVNWKQKMKGKKTLRKSSRQTLSFSSVARFKCTDLPVYIDLCRSIWTSKSLNVPVWFGI